jgi:hypothetical protein
MADTKRDAGPRTIFSVFLGLMLTAFVGVGIYTFYPPPGHDDTRRHELTARESQVRQLRPSDDLTANEREQLAAIERERRALDAAQAEAWKPWGRRTSMIIILFATLVMAVSLARVDPVISNGLLLGGVFTMLYGVGWIAATDTSITRFLVITAALVITLGLGYLRFVRRASHPETGGAPLGDGLSQIEERVRLLETRMNDAARALGSPPGA